MSKHVTVKMTDLPLLSFDDVIDMHEFLDIYEPAFARVNSPQQTGYTP